MLFVDQSDGGLYPPVGAQWGPRSRQHKLRTPGRNPKVYLCGALDAHSGRLCAGLWPRKHSAAFVDFLRGLLAALPQGPLHLILDNYGVHKSRCTQAFLAGAGRRLTLHFLPTYSPFGG